MKSILLKSLLLLAIPAMLVPLGGCTGQAENETSGKPGVPEEWRPEDASVARHITDVHGFVISPAPDSHLRVTRENGEILAEFREDVLQELGGEKALFILGWDGNPQRSSRFDYLFFLDALHAYLVLNAPKWDAGEGR